MMPGYQGYGYHPNHHPTPQAAHQYGAIRPTCMLGYSPSLHEYTDSSNHLYTSSSLSSSSSSSLVANTVTKSEFKYANSCRYNPPVQSACSGSSPQHSSTTVMDYSFLSCETGPHQLTHLPQCLDSPPATQYTVQAENTMYKSPARTSCSLAAEDRTLEQYTEPEYADIHSILGLPSITAFLGSEDEDSKEELRSQNLDTSVSPQSFNNQLNQQVSGSGSSPGHYGNASPQNYPSQSPNLAELQTVSQQSQPMLKSCALAGSEQHQQQQLSVFTSSSYTNQHQQQQQQRHQQQHHANSVSIYDLLSPSSSNKSSFTDMLETFSTVHHEPTPAASFPYPAPGPQVMLQ